MTDPQSPEGKALARRALPLLDLTSLNEEEDEATTDALCARAVSPAGRVAAVCLWPSFVPQARARLAGTGVRIATVVNFPGGSLSPEKVAEQTLAALADGADEIDVVIPYHSIMHYPNSTQPDEVLAATREAAGDAVMKVILETGSLAKPVFIERAVEIAVRNGADFLKTSTGKVQIGATLGAARIMLEACRDSLKPDDDGNPRRPVGFKASGGIRDLDGARDYLALADKICGPGWVSPATFRFGASGLLDALLAALGQGDGRSAATSGY
ncbi:deoxyribose-phosphate aldolase [Nitrospirillum viridazoti]|uniref:Deoxyribose-phosphate aldolase n=1 Tax=Nitrospirillum amazonense TaxID=28077 RepID=A0A560HM11_9PROT|nr:deoxyribose-phosphate aldolase [Nitrospirillum amazonense]TWB47568.1 deoxyribose-phosphate aldolase [Nitrospirillum amazonense]